MWICFTRYRINLMTSFSSLLQSLWLLRSSGWWEHSRRFSGLHRRGLGASGPARRNVRSGWSGKEPDVRESAEGPQSRRTHQLLHQGVLLLLHLHQGFYLLDNIRCISLYPFFFFEAKSYTVLFLAKMSRCCWMCQDDFDTYPKSAFLIWIYISVF